MVRRVVILGMALVIMAFSTTVWPQGFGSGSGQCIDPGPSGLALEYSAGHATNLGTSKSGLTEASDSLCVGVEYKTFHTLFFGFRLPVSISPHTTMRLGGSLIIPAVADVDSFDYDSSPPLLAREYSASTSWSTADAIIGYEIAAGVSALAGFRWDHWQSSFTDPRISPLFIGSLSPSDRGDFTANAYVPLVGIVTRLGGVSFGVLGFPCAFGDLVDHANANAGGTLVRTTARATFSQGYYAELFGDGKETAVVAGIEEESVAVDFQFRRHVLVIGGKVEFSFDMSRLTGRLPM